MLVSGASDYQTTSDGSSRCLDMVKRATKLTASSINFVPTVRGVLHRRPLLRLCGADGCPLLQLFWVSEDRPADATYNSQLNVSYYCYTRTTGGGCNSPSCCSPATQDELATFRSSMQTCFQAAIDAGLNIAISPHLDDGLGAALPSLLH